MVRTVTTIAVALVQVRKTVSKTVGAMEESIAGEGSQVRKLFPTLQARGPLGHVSP